MDLQGGFGWVHLITYKKYILPGIKMPEHDFTKNSGHGVFIEFIYNEYIKMTPKSWSNCFTTTGRIASTHHLQTIELEFF